MDSREIVGCIHQLFWSITVKNGQVVPPIEEATAMLDRYIANARDEALRNWTEDKVQKLASVAFNAHMGTPNGYKQMIDDMRTILADKQDPPKKPDPFISAITSVLRADYAFDTDSICDLLNAAERRMKADKQEQPNV